MSQELRLTIRGLYTHPSQLSEVPPGALETADNITIDRESIAESRRGFKQYSDPLANASKLFQFRGSIIAHDGAGFYLDDSGWSAITGAYAAPCPPIKVQSEEANNNLYLTTYVGIIKLDAPSSSFTAAGIAYALDLQCAISGVSGPIADDTAVAYRVLWGRRDANDNLVLGAPSARCIARNTAGADRSADLTFSIPDDITAADFYQVYRSFPTLNAADTPGDDLQLIIERSPTAGEITAGVVTVTDDVAEDQKGAFIYTAATQEGILQANYAPPLACDLTRFRQHMFYARTQRIAQGVFLFNQQPIAADTITINGEVYEAAVDFSIGATLEETLNNLAAFVNRNSSTVYVTLVDGSSVNIAARTFALTSFAVATSNSNLFNERTIEAEERKNRVYFSKLGQPEAVPLLNFIDVGSADKAILRILDVRDAVFVLKEDGIYRITGTTTDNFIQEQHDTTIRILGPETAVEFDNQVWCFSDQGVVAINVSGVRIMSRPIERTLLQIAKLSNFAEQAWAVGYDSDRKYILALPSTDADPNVKQLFVYNTIPDSWTRWPLQMVAGLVKEDDDLLYMIRGTDDQVVQERKSFTLADYADDEFPLDITGSGGFEVTVASVPSAVVVGMSIKQGVNEAVITAIDGLTLTVDVANLPWAVGAAAAYTPITTTLVWVEAHLGNPGVLKHWSECTFLFEDARFVSIEAGFSSNFFRGFQTIDITAQGEGAWGEATWGEFEWGGGVGGEQPIRTYFPKEVTRAHWVNVRLELTQAFTALSCNGVSLIANVMSTRFK